MLIWSPLGCGESGHNHLLGKLPDVLYRHFAGKLGQLDLLVAVFCVIAMKTLVFIKVNSLLFAEAGLMSMIDLFID